MPIGLDVFCVPEEEMCPEAGTGRPERTERLPGPSQGLDPLLRIRNWTKVHSQDQMRSPYSSIVTVLSLSPSTLLLSPGAILLE